MHQKPTILIIEDDATVLENIRRALEAADFMTLCVSTGAEGLYLLERHRPSLVLLDVDLPDMSGFDICRHIKVASDSINNPCVILLSDVHADTENRWVDRCCDADLFITLPISNSELVVNVRTMLRIHSYEKALRAEKAWSEIIIQSVPTLIVGLDEHCNILFLNRYAERLTGYKAEEVIGKNWIEWFISSDRQHTFQRAWNQVVTEQTVEHHCESAIVTRWGEERIIRWSNTLLTEKGRFKMFMSTGEDITDRKQTEKALRRRDAILSAVAFAAEELSKGNADHQSVEVVLARLGKDADVSRVYIFENHVDKNGTLMMSQRYEWVSPGISSQLDNPDLQNLPYIEAGLAHLWSILTKNEIYHGLVRDFPEPERRILERQQILSVAIVPIFVERKWWGFIGFDDCLLERRWSFPEIEALKAAAGVFGAYIQRMRAAEALRESEERLRTLINASPDIIMLMDGHGHWLEANDASLKCFYLKDVAYRGRSYSQLAAYGHAVTREIFRICEETDEEAWKTGSLWRGERHLPAPDGTTHTYDFIKIPLFFPNGSRKGLVTLGRDITERAQIEEKLIQSEETYRNLFQNAQVGLYRTRISDGKILESNEQLARMFGYDNREQFIAEYVTSENYVDPGTRERMLEIIGRDGCVENFEARFYRKDRSTFCVRFSARIYPERGWIEGVAEDISARKLIEAEKIKLEEQLRQAQKLESIGRLAGGVAHDFNNLLGVILGYGEIVLEDLHPEDPLRHNIQEMVTAGHRAQALTAQLLAFSRKQALQPQVLDLNHQLLDIEKMLRRIIGEDIELRLALSEDLPRVMFDPGQFVQVIINLAVNARDAMPEGGLLLIETSAVRLDDLYTESHTMVRPGEYVLLTVTDTGCGMDKETASLIFEPFFTTKEKGKGTGLGLSMVYGIVKQSGGYIWVYSESGKGATFKIYLPVVHAEVGDEKEIKIAEGPSGGEHILVVEDEESLRELIGNILTRLGYRVTMAADGGEALNLLEEQCLKPDLVISDVVMPKMSGKAMVDRMRQTLPDLKVLFMSGYTDNAIVHYGVLEQDTPFIQKPFGIQQFSKKIGEVLSKKR